MKIAPSLLSADFSRMEEALRILERGEADYAHIDVMDGHYVPNLTFGPPLIKNWRKTTSMFFDVHLMIQHPERSIDQYIEAGADRIYIHGDSTIHTHRLLHYIRSCGVQSGLAINPGEGLERIPYILDELDAVLLMSVNPGFGGQSFIPSVLKKIENLKKIFNKFGLFPEIEVDGGVNLNNAVQLQEAGVDSIVAGTAVFGAEDPVEAIRRFKKL